MMILLYILLIPVYLASPVTVELILLILNMFIPDPIPAIDEIAMVATIAMKVYGGDKNDG